MPGTTLSPTSALPRLGTPRSDLPSLGPRVGELAQLLGVPMMPWQQHVLNVSLERAGDRWRYDRVVVHVPRRAGKSTLTFVRQTHRAITSPGAGIWYGAQSRKEGLDIWRQQLREHILPHAKRLGCKERQSVGSEALRFTNGSEIALFTPSDSALVGLATDDVAVDEARFHSPARGLALEAGIRPTQATRDGQLWIISSSGTYGVSDWLWSWLQKGNTALEDPDSRVAFFDYSIPETGDPMDLDLVAAHHPAIGHTITREYLAAEQESMDPYDFAREYAGQWTKAVEQVIPAHDWAACADPKRPKPTPGDLVLAFAVSPTRTSASIAAAWHTPTGQLYVALLDHRPGEPSWLLPRLEELKERWKPKRIIYNRVGPAVSVADAVRRSKIRLTPASSHDYVVACGSLYEHILARTIAHHAQPELDDAVAGVGRRNLGERWVWGYKASEASISPLESVTLAAWGQEQRNAGTREPIVIAV